MRKDRYRNFAFILYPESVHENWKIYLEMLHVPCAISPLHDSDYNNDGTRKKPHWHVVLSYSGKKTVDSVLKVLAPLGVTYVEVVQNLKSMIRYLVHLDSPNKAQYDVNDIETLSGFDLGVMTQLTASQKEEVIIQIEQFIDDNNITEYRDLLRYLRLNKPEWHAVARRQTIHFNTYITSARNAELAIPDRD